MSNTTVTGSTVIVTPSTGLTGATAGTIAINTGTNWVTLGGGGGGGGGTGNNTYFTGSTGPTYSYGATGASYQDYSQSDIVLRRPGKPDLKVGESLDLIMERLSILTPDMTKLEKYAALKKAYEHYKLIESLIQEENKDGR